MCEFRERLSELISAFIDSTGKTCAWIAKEAGIGQETVRRALQQEATTNIYNTRAILSAIDCPINTVSEIMDLHPKNKTFNARYSKMTANDITADLLSNSTNALLINGFADKKSGTSREELLRHLPQKTGEATIERLLNKSVIREVNGKIKAKRYVVRHHKVAQQINDSINSLGQHLYACEDSYSTKYGSFIGARDQDGVDKINDILKQCISDVIDVLQDPNHEGDKVFFVGITEIGVK